MIKNRWRWLIRMYMTSLPVSYTHLDVYKRQGYGVTGVIVGDSYNSLTRYEYGSPYFYDNSVWHQGLSVKSNPNPDLKWETSKEFNIGLDWAVRCV